MPGVRHRGVRQLGALLLLVLLACPIALSGHRHHQGDLGASRASCTICAATAHAPALSPPAIPRVVLLAQGAGPERLAPAAPPAVAIQTGAPRAPPPASSTLIA